VGWLLSDEDGDAHEDAIEERRHGQNLHDSD
jgi:hypothetical protein